LDPYVAYRQAFGLERLQQFRQVRVAVLLDEPGDGVAPRRRHGRQTILTQLSAQLLARHVGFNYSSVTRQEL
jgi:hypothetical protein